MRVSLMLPGHYIELIKLCINKTHLTTRYGLVDQHIGREKNKLRVLINRTVLRYARTKFPTDLLALSKNEIGVGWRLDPFSFRIHKEMHSNKRIETKKLKFENRKAFYK